LSSIRNNSALLQHFKNFGLNEGRKSSSIFDVKFYLNNNNDLKNAKFTFKQAFQHFVVSGFGEGRAGVGNITVTSPNGGNSLQAGSNHNITWSDNISENVKVDLFKGGVFAQTIFASTFSDGSESWIVPTSLASGTDYQIKISSVSDTSLSDFSNSNFTVANIPAYQSNELLIKTPLGMTNNQLLSYAQSYNVLSITNLVETTPLDSALSQWRVLKFASGTNLEQAKAAFGSSGNYEAVEYNYQLSINWTPNDSQFSSLWGLNNTGQTGGNNDADIDAVEAWDIQKGSRSVVVAVIDTGIDYTHPDLVSNIWKNSGEISGNGLDDDGNGFIDDVYGYDFANNDGNPMDDHSHGTHVAGTIGASGNNNLGVIGVSPNVSIMGLKFLRANGFGSTVNAARAIEYAVKMGAKVINASFGGGGYSNLMFDALSRANNAGVLFVAAAGNDRGNNNDANPRYPSNYDLPNVISVAATDNKDQLAYFSNYGVNTVDLGAPGVSILSTIPNNGYASNDGTSMATPHVAGAAALLLAENPSLTVTQLKQALLNSTDQVASLQGKTVSGGRLNLNKAIASVSKPTITINANDANAAEVVSGQTQNSGQFTLTRTGNIANGLTAFYTIGGTAINGTDYGSLSGSVIFDAGSATSRSINISVIDDSIVEGNETVILTLNSNSAYTIGAANTATVTITDNDLPTLVINDVIIAEGNSGTSSAVFTVTRMGNATQAITVNYATANNSATAGSDYTGTSGILTFATNETSKIIIVPIIGDTTVEGNETFFVNLSNAVNATIADSQGLGTITNDDIALPTITINANDANAAEVVSGQTQNSGQFTLTRTGNIANGLTAFYTIGGTAINGTDYGSLGGSVIFDAGSATSRTINISVIDDSTVEGNETVILTLNSNSAYTIGAANTATVIITDNDSLPTLDWTRQLGTSNHDYGTDTAVDANGNIYVVGMMGQNLGGSNNLWGDAFISKVNSNGNTLWTRQIGGTNIDIANGVTVDSSGNIYIVGATENSLGGNTYAGGGSDAFFAKYDTNGNQIWIRQFGTTNYDMFSKVATDSSGNFYAVGWTGSGSGPYYSTADALIVKWDSNGNQLWSRQFVIGANQGVAATDIDIDSNTGNIYITGYFRDDSNTSFTDTDAFIAKYNSNGNQLWLRQEGDISGSGQDWGVGVAVDNVGNVYLAGDSYNDFVIKYDSNGNKLWTREWGFWNSGTSGIDVDSFGNVYLTGNISGSLDGQTYGGSYDAYITRFDSNGNRNWSDQFGSAVMENPNHIVIDSANNIYLVGQINQNTSDSSVWLAKYRNV